MTAGCMLGCHLFPFLENHKVLHQMYHHQNWHQTWGDVSFYPRIVVVSDTSQQELVWHVWPFFYLSEPLSPNVIWVVSAYRLGHVLIIVWIIYLQRWRLAMFNWKDGMLKALYINTFRQNNVSIMNFRWILDAVVRKAIHLTQASWFLAWVISFWTTSITFSKRKARGREALGECIFKGRKGRSFPYGSLGCKDLQGMQKIKNSDKQI